MFIDFKFFDEVIAKLEEQRKVTVKAWKDWIDAVERMSRIK